MSFSFGFSGDDIEDDGEDELVDDMSKHQISEHAKSNVVATLEPKKHTFQEMVSSKPCLPISCPTIYFMFAGQIYPSRCAGSKGWEDHDMNDFLSLLHAQTNGTFISLHHEHMKFLTYPFQ